MQLNPAYQRYRKILRTLCVDSPAASWTGILYRTVSERYSAFHNVVSGKGAMERGGRYNHPGSFPVVYASMDAEASRKESVHNVLRAGLKPKQDRTSKTISIAAQLQRVLSLTEPSVVHALDLTRSQLTDQQWFKDNSNNLESITQALGRAAKDSGYDGIRVPSGLDPTSENMLIVTDNLLNTSQLQEV